MKYLTISLIAASIFFTSCGDDVECTAEAFNAETQSEVIKYNSTVDTYNSDPTEDNCKELRKAAENFLETVESYGECTELDQDGYQQTLDNARAIVSGLPC